MDPTAPSHDPTVPPSALQRLWFEQRRLRALWRWRHYSREDATFINRLLKAGVALEVIWDVGASNGAWSWIVGRQIPTLRHHLFEPLACHVGDYADTLRHHLASHPNWTFHPVALGARDEVATIYADAQSYGSSFVAGEFGRKAWRAVDVPVRAGQSLISAGEAPPPDLLKADVQGFELEILKGLEDALPGIKALLLETWLSRGYGPATPLLTELIDWLRPRGFMPVDVGDGYRDGTGFLRSIDVCFLRTDVAAQAGFSF